MLDYDYEERMTPRQMSVWVNREFNSADGQGAAEGDLGYRRSDGVGEVLGDKISCSRLCGEEGEGKSKRKKIVEVCEKKSVKTSERRMKEIRDKINREKILGRFECDQ